MTGWTPMSALFRLLTALCLVVLLAGCGDDPHEKESTMTPDKANTELSRVARAVMGVLAPGQHLDLEEAGPPTPCGGLGGNEFNKIKYELAVEAPAASTNAAADFDAVAAKLRQLGYEVEPTETMGDGTSFNFRGDAVKGTIFQHGPGPLSLGAETACLDNPDRAG